MIAASGSIAAEVLRAQLLEDLDDDVWPMAHVESVVTRRKLADTPHARQALVLDVLGLLLSEGLILVGDVVGGDPAYIDPWPGTPAEVLDRIRSLYVERYADQVKWDLRIWISPNDERKVWRHNDIGRRCGPRLCRSSLLRPAALPARPCAMVATAARRSQHQLVRPTQDLTGL